MPAIAEAPVGSAARPAQKLRLGPAALFWICGLVFYGAIAAQAATGHFLDQSSRDIWQHLAALKALIADPIHPVNPFIPTNDSSRHFQPYWVSVALLARLLGWNEWQAYAFASFLSAGVLLGGIYTFGREFYRDRRGPLALLAAMALGWIFPIEHTGYHSPSALLDGFAYPATFLIGLSLVLWALVIRALAKPRLALVIAPLGALMFATHQLGAGIGFILAGWLALLWPNVSFRNRAAALGAIAIGLAASALWPYFNPFGAVLRTGNTRWTGGPDFYGAVFLVTALVPQAAGLIGLLHPDFRRSAGAVLAAFGTYTALFLLGLAGVLIATRFLMPAVLMLHIGLGALLLVVARRWKDYSDRRRLALFGLGAAVVSTFAITSSIWFNRHAQIARRDGSDAAYAMALTRDIPDMQPVAVYDVAVWPVIATGQRAVSEPWPEPGIADLAQRQAATETLFDPTLSRDARVALAQRWGVRTLIMHRKGALRRKMPAHLIETLQRQAVRQERSGPFLRFDLY